MYRRYMNVGDVTGALLADTSGNREVFLMNDESSHQPTYCSLSTTCIKQKISEEGKTIALV